MEYFAQSDAGNHREQNEDFFYACENLFIVADGMGGHNAGEVASRTAVDSFVEFFLKKTLKKINLEKKSDHLDLKKNMLDAAIFANRKVYELSITRKDYSGMGTTFTACFMKDNTASIVHIGDTRIYLLDEHGFKLVTEDQTLVGKMHRNGLLTYEETYFHPLRNYLENVLGLDSEIETDTFSLPISPGNILIMCSDGLNSMLRDEEIGSTVKKYREPKKVTEELISHAKRNGGLDNITVITIKI